MLDGFIAHHAPPRSAAFFVDLGRVMARNIGAILTLKSSLLQSDQLAIPEPGPEPETQRPNHPRPETPSPPVPDKRIRIASISTDAGTIFDWSSPFKSSPLNTESEASSSFKESSSVVEEDDDAGQDHAHCETVTQAMLLSFLQAISNARYDPTSTSRRFAFSFVYVPHSSSHSS
ncbi:hypothetical protein BDD12DRAFT_300556 [Trichophaea hybrida]|nr:hypothetical protein BDD12DRAFT_300556 [Trichophaea hybrida]